MGHEEFGHTPCPECCNDPLLIRLAYVFGLALWILLLLYIGYTPINLVDIVIMLIPPSLFLIAMWSVSLISPYTETLCHNNSSMSNIVILIFPILVWATAKVDNNLMFLLLVLLATGLAVVSLVDIWVGERYLGLVKHLRSICQTLSIGLTLLALIQYYHDRRAKKTQPRCDISLDDDDEVIAAEL